MDAEGFQEQTPCPDCGSLETVTYLYIEGFEEIECLACGFRSDSEALAELQRAAGDLLERRREAPPTLGGEELVWVPFRSMKA